jgi:hypothetical protein
MKIRQVGAELFHAERRIFLIFAKHLKTAET